MSTEHVDTNALPIPEALSCMSADMIERVHADGREGLVFFAVCGGGRPPIIKIRQRRGDTSAALIAADIFDEPTLDVILEAVRAFCERALESRGPNA